MSIFSFFQKKSFDQPSGYGGQAAEDPSGKLPATRLDPLSDDAMEKWYQFVEASEQHTDQPQRVNIVKSEKTLLELMSTKEEHALTSFCRYSMVDEGSGNYNADRQSMASCVLKAFHSWPECLHYVFSWDEYTWIRTTCLTSGAARAMPEDPDTVAKLLNLGFAEIRLQHEDGTDVAEISTASDLDVLFSEKKNKHLKKIYSGIEQDMNVLSALMTFYGVMEVDALYQNYPTRFHRYAEAEDFSRFIYWHCGYNRLFYTGADSAGRKLLIHYALDPWEAAQQFFVHPKLPYKIFDDQDIESMLRGVKSCYLEWRFYYNYLTSGICLPEAEANLEVADTFLKVFGGCRIDELMKTLQDTGSSSIKLDSWESASLWANAMDLAMNIGLPLFHGYSRSEAMQQWNLDAKDLAFFPNKRYKKMNKKTRIANMDPDLQLQIYRKYDDESSICSLESVLRKTGCANYEIRYLLIQELIREGEYDRAESEAELSIKDTGDRQLENLLHDISTHCRNSETFEKGLREYMKENLRPNSSLNPSHPFGGFDGTGALNGTGDTTLRRNQPKIGRNSPCPCGNGKKYKHCCGK